LAHEKNEEQQERDENMRFLGNGMKIHDPFAEKYSPFYVMVTGAVESGTMNDTDGISCGFEFTSGTDWQLHSVSISSSNSLFLFRETKPDFLNTPIKVNKQTEE
jgi:hypothetical protein